MGDNDTRNWVDSDKHLSAIFVDFDIIQSNNRNMYPEYYEKMP